VPNRDTITGVWRLLPPVAPITDEQTDSVFTAVLARLKAMQVIPPVPPAGYCLVLERDDSAMHERLARLLHSRAPSDYMRPHAARAGCERDPGYLRLVLRSVHTTENGRVVVYLAGDHLEEWPPGFEGRWHRAWAARCVGDVRVTAGCGVMPEPRGPAAKREDPRDEAGPFRITAVAMLNGAFHRDTLSAPVAELAEWTEYGTSWSPPPAVACADAGECPARMGESQVALAKDGHLRFRVGDLRPESRTGSWLLFRVYTNRSEPAHQPIAVVHRSRRWLVQFLREIGENTWEYGIITGYPPENRRPRLPGAAATRSARSVKRFGAWPVVTFRSGWRRAASATLREWRR
jgi:hypothetical protein